ncbi:head-tail connector protein [Kaistia defluvii]|uniref:PhiE125 gp8 family phage protein n=1 Tax=Kaistia defluvii TaxID=410841 RepID=A0ABV2R2R7_9HYPH
MHVTVVTPPGAEAIVTLADAKQHLRVDSSDEDILIQGLISAACEWIDGPNGWVGRSFGKQTLEARFSRFDCDFIALPYGPVIEVGSIKYLDTSGTEQTMPGTGWGKLSDGRVALTASGSWPALYSNAEAVRVTYDAGYAEGKVPAAVRAAVLLTVDYLFQNRGASVDEALTAGAVLALLSPYRAWSA